MHQALEAYFANIFSLSQIQRQRCLPHDTGLSPRLTEHVCQSSSVALISGNNTSVKPNCVKSRTRIG